MTKLSEQYNELKNRLEVKTLECNLVNQRLQRTAHYQQQAEIDDLKKSVAELTGKIKTCQEQEKINTTKANKIEEDIKNSKGNKEARIKEAESEVKKLEKQAQNSKNLWQQKEQNYETMKLEITELKNAITAGQEQIENCEKTIVEFRAAVEQTDVIKNEAESVCKKYTDELKGLKTVMNSKNAKIKKILTVKSKILAENNELELKMKEGVHNVSELKNSYKECQSRVSVWELLL